MITILGKLLISHAFGAIRTRTCLSCGVVSDMVGLSFLILALYIKGAKEIYPDCLHRVNLGSFHKTYCGGRDLDLESRLLAV